MNCWSRALLFVLISVVVTGAGNRQGFAVEPPVSCVTFAPDGSVLIGSEAGVQCRSWPELKPSPAQIKVEMARVHDLKFAPNGKQLAVAGGQPGVDGVIELWDWTKSKRTNVYAVSDDVVYAVDWSPNSDQLIAGCSANHLSVIDSESGEVVRVDGHSKSVFAVAALRNQGWLSGGADRSVRWWRRDLADTSQGAPLRRTLNNHTDQVVAIVSRPSQQGLPMAATAGLDGTVRLWQPTIGRLVRFARLPSPPMAIVWTSDGSALAAACRNGQVYVIDPDTVEVADAGKAVDSWAYCIAAAPDGTGFVVGGSRGQLHRVPWKR